MSNFDLKDLLNNRSKETNMQVEEYKTDGVVELVDIYDMIPSQDNFYSVKEIMDLVNSIKLVGILQPLLLSESEEADKFSIKAGHRRQKALLYLVEQEGLSEYRYAPAIIKPEQDDIISRLTIIMANRFREKTDWEKMQEVVQTEELLKELNGNKNINSQTREQLKKLLGVDGDKNMSTRDFVAEILGTSSTQVGRYKTIYNNMCLEMMKMFEESLINVSVAAEVAALTPDWQMEAFSMLREKGSLQIADIKNLKQQEENSKPIAGQIKINDIEISEKEKESKCIHFPKCYLCDVNNCNSRQEDRTKCIYDNKKSCNIKHAIKTMYKLEPQLEKDCNGCCMNCKDKFTCGYACHNSKIGNVQKDEKTTDTFEANPEYKDILCYSCLHYAECDKKTGTVFKCDSYENKAESEKTPEQLYSEEQDKIDRETAKKLEEMRRAEIESKKLPSSDKRPARNDFEITVTLRQYAEIYYGHINFIVTLKKDYQMNDEITIKEYRHGEPTGKEMTVKVKNVLQDCTGIEDAYCVIGFYKVQKKETGENEA